MKKPGKKIKTFHPTKYLKELYKGFYISFSLFLFFSLSMLFLLIIFGNFGIFYIFYIIGLIGIIKTILELNFEFPVIYKNGISPIELKLKYIILKKRTFIHFNDIWKFPYHNNLNGGYAMRIYLRDGKSYIVEVDKKEDIDLILNAYEKFKFV